MLRKALQHIIDDSSFHIPVEPAATALQQAKSVLEWGCQESQALAVGGFEERLVQELGTIFPTGFVDTRSFVTARFDICRHYHTLRTAPHFITLWTTFMKGSIDCSLPEPTFYQEVTDLIFEQLLQANFPILQSEQTSEPASITYEDANVIRYAAGYVCRKIYDQIEKSSRPNKVDLMKCVMMLQDEDKEPTTTTADWVNEVDRGGLWQL